MNIEELMDQKVCNCGHRAVVVVETGGIDIYLCLECLNDLFKSIKEFNSHFRCYQCNNFRMSESGWDYGGSCFLQANMNGKTIKPSDYGYLFYKDCMNICDVNV